MCLHHEGPRATGGELAAVAAYVLEIAEGER